MLSQTVLFLSKVEIVGHKITEEWKKRAKGVMEYFEFDNDYEKDDQFRDNANIDNTASQEGEDNRFQNYNERSNTEPRQKCELESKDRQDDDRANELRLTMRTLWKTGLEVFIHQLLYRRGIYPQDTFSSIRFVGAECKINNHPGVLIYIAEAVKDIISAIWGHNDVDQKKSPSRHHLKDILIEIYDQKTEFTHEQYSLSFSSTNSEDGSFDENIPGIGLNSSFSNSSSYSAPSQDEADYLIKHLEKDLRDLVCSTGKLDRPKSLAWDDSISFKILLKTNQSAELDMGLGGKWSPKQSSISHFQAGNRVIFNLANYGCQFQYRLISNEDRVSQSS